MAKGNFILVSLKEDEAKQLAQVISNDTSRRLLDHLASVKDATESELSRALGLPISTVHYNLSAMQKARLVDVEDFHYSPKGKEVNHYRLANKYVIIAPKEAAKGLKAKLRQILPVAAVSAAGAAALHFMGFQKESGAVGPLLAERSDAAPMLAAESFAEAATPWGASLALWFFFGALFAIAIFLLVDWVQRRRG